MKLKWSLLLLALLAACHQDKPAPVANAERPAMTMIAGNLAGENSHFYSGDIRARHETALSFRVGGKVLERLVDVGANVKAGQALAKLDGSDAKLQRTAADSQWQLAEAEVKRYRELRGQGFISQSALDAKETAFKAASSQAGISQNQENYTILRAEHAGVVVATWVEAGQVVGAGQTVFRLAQNGEREVAIALPENEFGRIKVGAEAEISLWNGNSEGAHFKGRLRELTPMADASNRTYAGRVTVLDANAEVALGMSAQVRFKHAAQAKELLGPSSAIFQQGEQAAVWVVADDHRVSLRPVKVSVYRDEGVVIASGLRAGERIVIAGVHKLAVGEKVHALDNGSAQ